MVKNLTSFVTHEKDPSLNASGAEDVLTDVKVQGMCRPGYPSAVRITCSTLMTRNFILSKELAVDGLGINHVLGMPVS